MRRLVKLGVVSTYRGFRRNRWTVNVAVAVVMLGLAGTTPAMAQDLNGVAQAILDELNGTFLQLVAGVAVIIVALMMMFGHLRPVTGFTVMAGIAIAASATTIAGKLFGGV